MDNKKRLDTQRQVEEVNSRLGRAGLIDHVYAPHHPVYPGDLVYVIRSPSGAVTAVFSDGSAWLAPHAAAGDEVPAQLERSPRTHTDVMHQLRDIARRARRDGLTTSGDVVEDVAAWEIYD